MKYILKLLFSLFLLVPIFGFGINRSKIGDEIVQEFSKKIAKNKKWKLYVTGGSFYNPKKIIITIGFSIDKIKTRSEIRKMTIETTELFIDFINSKEKYKSIFYNSELDRNNIELTFTFDEGYIESKPEIIAHVISSNSSIKYYYRSSNTGNLVALDDGVETYEQARAIVMQEESGTQEVHNDLRENNSD